MTRSSEEAAAESSTWILAPVSSRKWRITEPPLPMRAPVLEAGHRMRKRVSVGAAADGGGRRFGVGRSKFRSGGRLLLEEREGSIEGELYTEEEEGRESLERYESWELGDEGEVLHFTLFC